MSDHLSPERNDHGGQPPQVWIELERKIVVAISRLERIEEQAHEQGQKRTVDRVWDWITKASVPVILLVSGWAIGVEIRVQAIEGSRFTQSHGRDLADRIIRLENNFPLPQWLREDVKDIKALLRDMDNRLRAVEAKVK